MTRYRIRSFNAAQAAQWLTCGWRLWKRQPQDLTAPLAAFALLVLVLRAIPVIGDIVLLLLLPSVVSSYWMYVHSAVHAAGRPGAPRDYPVRGGLRGWLDALRPALVGVWAKTENVFPLILLGLVLVALGLVAHALLGVVGGQAVVSPYPFLELLPADQWRLIAGYALVALFWWLVAALLLWTLPLFAIHDLTLIGALALNLKAVWRNRVAAGMLLLVPGVLLLPAAILKLWSPWASGLAMWLCLVLAALIVGLSGYCSFRLMFAQDLAAGNAPPAADLS